MVRTLAALAIVVSSVVSSCPAGSEEESSSSSDPLLTVVVSATAEESAPVEESPPIAEPSSTVAAEPAVVEVDYYAAVLYTLRRMSAEELIRIAWEGTGQADRAISIARRESGLRCDAKNPRSSATGLFQTLSLHRPRAERLGLSWHNVSGPDCLDDVILAAGYLCGVAVGTVETHRVKGSLTGVTGGTK